MSESTHIGRSWATTAIEDECPCPQAPCGLVIADQVDPTCAEHAWSQAKSIRQSHPASQCPGDLRERERRVKDQGPKQETDTGKRRIMEETSRYLGESRDV